MDLSTKLLASSYSPVSRRPTTGRVDSIVTKYPTKIGSSTHWTSHTPRPTGGSTKPSKAQQALTSSDDVRSATYAKTAAFLTRSRTSSVHGLKEATHQQQTTTRKHQTTTETRRKSARPAISIMESNKTTQAAQSATGYKLRSKIDETTLHLFSYSGHSTINSFTTISEISPATGKNTPASGTTKNSIRYNPISIKENSKIAQAVTDSQANTLFTRAEASKNSSNYGVTTGAKPTTRSSSGETSLRSTSSGAIKTVEGTITAETSKESKHDQQTTANMNTPWTTKAIGACTECDILGTENAKKKRMNLSVFATKAG
ncbi:hypothetical protein OSTOST_08639, partial [Ostertagia ostertagi]